MLKTCAMGFGAVFFDALNGIPAFADDDVADANRLQGTDPLRLRLPHFPARAKRVIFLYMDGGVSQVDSFDPKPLLDRYDGEPPDKFFKVQPTQFNKIGNILPSPWKSRKYGESGIPVSDLFPHIAQCVDDLCLIRSLTSKFPEHTNANYFLHTGSGLQGRPSMGAWATYGLGSECENLPGFIVLNGGLIPPGGLDNFNSGYLPASYQGSIFRSGSEPVANLNRPKETAEIQSRKLALMHKIDQGAIARDGRHDAVESAITNYELAYKMQMAVPKLMDLSNESDSLKRLYGFESRYEPTQIYARQCMLARRFAERGVRFIELTCPKIPGKDRWDAHKDLRKNHSDNARAVDQPIAALLKDLKARGMLDETLVVWAGEFGRTPFAQGRDGRDHNQFCNSVWLAGGGVKGGMIYGKTDEFGYQVIEGRLEMHDFHATILHLLGLDHERSTFRFSGRDMRLTDVHGHVLHDIIA